MSDPATPETAPVPWRRDLLWLAVLFGLLFFFRLGSYPLGTGDEGRYAEIPREMIASGDWVVPRLNGVYYFEKPPLMYWLTAISETVFGQNAWAVRAVPAALALAGVLLTYAAGRALRGREGGFLSALVLGTSLLYFAIGRIPLLDMGLSVLMAATLFCFLLAVREPPGRRRRLLFYGLYASAALATLTKGLIGFLVSGAVMFLWLLVFNQWRRLRPLHLPTGILLFLAIAAPWHVLAAMRADTWAHRYFVFEHFQRFFTPVAQRPGAWYYYIGVIVAGLIPWIGFLWPAVRESLRGGWAARARNVDSWYLVTWVAFIFLFFTKSQSKLIPYILPVFPALAVLIGGWLAEVLATPEAPRRLRGGLRVFAFVCGLLAVALLVAVARPALVRLEPAKAAALQWPAYIMATALFAGGILAPWLARVRSASAALLAMAATMAVFLATLLFAAPYLNKPTTQPLALQVRVAAQPGDRVLHYRGFFHDFTFYAGRVVDVVAYKDELELEEDAAARASGRFLSEAEFRQLWSGPTRLWVVAKRRDTKELFADASFRYHLLGQTDDHYLFSNQP
ncbi:MAG TPA: glycosyltransferase family 39 protein [Opitutaceae bacterium]|nr:glycosyltransferase family 39 protein [Opitutaceae bacterium]HND59878.1 glycosyltransferase family 39 protein [Opitutaceae bacterium]